MIDSIQALVFEDAINGVISAKAAGMNVVCVPDPRMDKSLAQDADLIVASLEDVVPEEWGLPPYNQSL